MMINFPFLKLPMGFVELLKDDFREGNSQDKRIEKFLRQNSAIRVLVEQGSRESNENHSMNSMIKSYGWKLIRDKMAILYLNKFEFGNYEVRHEDNYFLKDILSMEEAFYDYGTSGNSRLFLLGFYLRMAEFDLARRMGKTDINLVKETLGTLEYLKLRTSKSLRIDWLILSTLHLLGFFGNEGFHKALIEANFEYQKIYEKIDETYKKSMLNNFINYGSSIDDEYVLLNDIN